MVGLEPLGLQLRLLVAVVWRWWLLLLLLLRVCLSPTLTHCSAPLLLPAHPQMGWPMMLPSSERDIFVRKVHETKVRILRQKMLGEIPLRPGVAQVRPLRLHPRIWEGWGRGADAADDWERRPQGPGVAHFSSQICEPRCCFGVYAAPRPPPAHMLPAPYLLPAAD